MTTDACAGYLPGADGMSVISYDMHRTAVRARAWSGPLRALGQLARVSSPSRAAGFRSPMPALHGTPVRGFDRPSRALTGDRDALISAVSHLGCQRPNPMAVFR